MMQFFKVSIILTGAWLAQKSFSMESMDWETLPKLDRPVDYKKYMEAQFDVRPEQVLAFCQSVMIDPYYQNNAFTKADISMMKSAEVKKFCDEKLNKGSKEGPLSQPKIGKIDDEIIKGFEVSPEPEPEIKRTGKRPFAKKFKNIVIDEQPSDTSADLTSSIIPDEKKTLQIGVLEEKAHLEEYIERIEANIQILSENFADLSPENKGKIDKMGSEIISIKEKLHLTKENHDNLSIIISMMREDLKAPDLSKHLRVFNPLAHDNDTAEIYLSNFENSQDINFLSHDSRIALNNASVLLKQANENLFAARRDLVTLNKEMLEMAEEANSEAQTASPTNIDANINAPINEHGDTLLIKAVFEQNEAEVISLLERGADPLVAKYDGATAANFAEWGKSEEIKRIISLHLSLKASSAQ